jgi:hypothetical protein
LIQVDSLNFILSLLIFLTVIVNYQKGLWWALGTGLFSELYSNSFFGIIALSLLATVILINFLFNNLLSPLIYSHKPPDIRDVKRFFPHVRYTGKVEKKSSLYRF